MEIIYTSRYVRDERATVLKGHYGNGEIALVLRSNVDGERLATATVNLEAYGTHPSEGNVFIKDYAENEGTLACLIEQGVVSEPVRTVQCGWAEAYECTLLDADEIEELV
jgi:hypothetical protein